MELSVTAQKRSSLLLLEGAFEKVIRLFETAAKYTCFQGTGTAGVLMERRKLLEEMEICIKTEM